MVWSERFAEFLQSPTAQLVIWSGVLVGVVLIGFYVISKFRPTRDNGSYSTSDWISHFRELHSSGVLAEEEFRTIKTKLARQMRDELLAESAAAESSPSQVSRDGTVVSEEPAPGAETDSDNSHTAGNGAPE